MQISTEISSKFSREFIFVEEANVLRFTKKTQIPRKLIHTKINLTTINLYESFCLKEPQNPKIHLRPKRLS